MSGDPDQDTATRPVRLLAVAVLALAPLAGALGTVGAQPDPGEAVPTLDPTPLWQGNWYVNERGNVDLSPGLPAQIGFEGETSPGGSKAWSYAVTTATGQQYTCEYVPELHDDNVGEGHVHPATEPTVSRPGNCTLTIPSENSIFANYVFASFDLAENCVPDRPPLECDSDAPGVVFEGPEVGIFNVPRNASTGMPEHARSAVGDWSWFTSVSGLDELTSDQPLLTDRGQLVHQAASDDWLFRGERGTLVCAETDVFFYPHASPAWWPLRGDCDSLVDKEGETKRVRVSANFSAGGQLRVDENVFGTDFHVTYLGGCGEFVVTGEERVFDPGYWLDALTKPHVNVSTHGDSEVRWAGADLLLTMLFAPTEHPRECTES